MKFIFLILIFIFTLSDSSLATDNVFIFDKKILKTIPPEKMFFTENLDANATVQDLNNAIWYSELKSNQSFVKGYWVKIVIKNSTNDSDVGFNHNWNREKKIYTLSSLGVTEYPYWKYKSDPPLDEGRILGQYKIHVPLNENVIVYNFFRSKPFDRYYGITGGLDRITIGSWENIRFREYFRAAGSVAFVAVGFSFGLYYLFIFLVSRGNYLWLSFTLFQAAVTVLLTQSGAMYIGVGRWINNSELSFCFYSVLFILLIQFFRKSLDLSDRFKRIDKAFIYVIIFYLMMFFLNLFTGLQWPGPELFNLKDNPPDNLGPGIVKLKFLVIPFCIAMFSSIILSLVAWVKGNQVAKFMFFSFMLPFLSLPIILITYAFFGFTWITMLVGTTSAGFLFLFMFITFGLAVAQQINELKRLALLQQIQLTQAYQRFVPRQLLENLKKESILDVNLGDQVRREMTIMFSDIREFTSISEKMTAEQNFGFVNAYLNEMGPIVRNHNGYIDKFMGDGIMALFPESPVDAIKTAIKMQHELTIFNQNTQSGLKQPIRIGIGVNTGMMMLGTIGEADRMEGSVISDAVNLAARLEQLTKLYKSKVLISHDTLIKIRGHKFTTRLVDFVAVKGRQGVVKVYELLDAEPSDIYNIKLETLSLFNEAINVYRDQDIISALKLFNHCRDNHPLIEDGAVEYYIKRCQNLLTEGWDKSSWDGVNRMEFK